ncbi:hypothetical protein F7725_011142 [Dissostichus mawsoni]|uniref:Ferric-chelate reductase 1 n=1 Tax=Dissostichus mawsoni TaxID=36200 RepID=A0A7J5Z9U9_DISMA|nr:hypothetical protein F7725_011142 [Dissostichus mawsoni]
MEGGWIVLAAALLLFLSPDVQGTAHLSFSNNTQGTSMLFICAQNSADNGTFFFRTMQMNNTSNMLTPTERRVKEIRGMVNGNMIKCEFTVPNVNASNTRSSEDTTFSVLLGNGSFDGSAFGLFIRLLDSKPLDLTKPDSNVPAPTTMPNNSGALQPHAVLLLLSVLTLSVLLRTPNNCDPSGNSSCLFVSAVSSVPVPPNGVDLSIELSGESARYIAVGFTANASEGTSMLFICAQNSSDNGTFFFRTMERNNTDDMLTATERRVKEIRGMVNGNMIKCEFTVPNVNASNTRSSEDTTFSVLLGNGSFDGSALGAFNLLLKSRPLDLTKPNSNVPSTAAPISNTTLPITTMPSITTMPNNSGALQPHAVLLLLSVLTLSVLLRV